MKRLPVFCAAVLSTTILAAMGCSKGPSGEGGAPDGSSTAASRSQRSKGDDWPAPLTPPELPPTPPDSETLSMNPAKDTYGGMPDGTTVYRYTMTNAHGLKVRVITYGATIASVDVPDRHGRLENVTLYCDSLRDYANNQSYFGCVVGRYANRIAKGKFSLDGTEYTLATNNNANHLHGGKKGFDKCVWDAVPVRGKGFAGVTLSLMSPDGDEGYPGTFNAKVTYTLTDNDELKMEYTATTDKPTVVNLSNHAYWNLAGAGAGDVLGHVLTINADRYLPVDAGLIPLGKLETVKGTPMDFTTPHTIGSRIDQVEGGYDHCYVLSKKKADDLTLAVRLSEPTRGRVMEVWSTQPGLQLYTGNFLDGSASGGGVAYQQHFAVCLETEHFPDSPNHPDFSSTVLRPGQTYHQVTVHKFSIGE